MDEHNEISNDSHTLETQEETIGFEITPKDTAEHSNLSQNETEESQQSEDFMEEKDQENLPSEGDEDEEQEESASTTIIHGDNEEEEKIEQDEEEINNNNANEETDFKTEENQNAEPTQIVSEEQINPNVPEESEEFSDKTSPRNNSEIEIKKAPEAMVLTSPVHDEYTADQIEDLVSRCMKSSFGSQEQVKAVSSLQFLTI